MTRGDSRGSARIDVVIPKPDQDQPSASVSCRPIKRVYDLFFSFIGLLVLSPVLLVLAVLVKCSDGGPVFYLQERVGLGGRVFRIWKFRSMVVNADRLGIAVTRDGDPRITRVGRFLRKTKLDELPQLWNVFVGEMSLVGPRPEVPKYVAHYSAAQRRILDLKPGITDLATLRFRNEEELLRSAKDTESFYLEYCVPRKIELNLEYARRAGVWGDTMIILRTLWPWSRRMGKSEDPITGSTGRE
jgi:lipopolysaccharide/colanic/teichoic acid biosynthesis glycosyltransferase